MKFNLKTGIAAGLAAAAMVLAPAASAGTLIQFSSFTQQGSGQTVQYDEATKSVTTIASGGANTRFSFNALDIFNLQSKLTLNLASTSTPTAGPGANDFHLGGLGGSFSFIYSGPNQTITNAYGTFNFVSGVTNLLSGSSIQGATLTANLPGSGGIEAGNMSLGTNLVFTSDIFDLNSYVLNSASFSLTALNRSLASTVTTAGNQVARGSIGGNFSAAIPEPGTWAMMILGFGMLGFALRRRALALA